MTQSFKIVGVIGVGIMGAGIAQVAVQAGCHVKLYDARDGTAQIAIDKLQEKLKNLINIGKISTEEAAASIDRLSIASNLADLHDCELIIEAISEDLTIKKALFKSLELVCAHNTVFASNTSSLSITAIAAGLQRPENVVGMHFFNPAPVLPLVEVVSGHLTAETTAERIAATAIAWHKKPVRCKSTPGFIVNRVARPFYGEALRVLESGGTDVATIDLVLREVGGFRMGAFELIDLVGLDNNLAVSKNIWNAYFQDSRYRPTVIQTEMVAGGLLGRKSGRGFYTYPYEHIAPPASNLGPVPSTVQYLTESETLAPLLERIKASGIKVQSRREDDPFGAGMLRVGNATICLTDGRSATQTAYEEELTNVIMLDLARDFSCTQRVALAKGDNITSAAIADAIGLFRALGIAVTIIDDLPGLIVARTIAMLANEAADAALYRIASPEAIDDAMKLGLNHPQGPLETADRLGLNLINTILVNLHAHTGDDRYRQSLLLQRKVWGGHRFR